MGLRATCSRHRDRMGGRGSPDPSQEEMLRPLHFLRAHPLFHTHQRFPVQPLAGLSTVSGNCVGSGGSRLGLLWRVGPWQAARQCGGAGSALGAFLSLGASVEGNSPAGCDPADAFSGSEAIARGQPQHRPHTVATWLSFSWHLPQSVGLPLRLFLHSCLCHWAPGAGPEGLYSWHLCHLPVPGEQEASALSGNYRLSGFGRVLVAPGGLALELAGVSDA